VAIQPDASPLALPSRAVGDRIPRRTRSQTPTADAVFELTAPLYAFMREHLFRDDTDRIARSLWLAEGPPAGALLLEVGCGPGFYARRLAARYPGVRAVGVDSSAALLELARARVASDGIANCRFQRGDAVALDWSDASVDSVIASRLFTVVDAPRVLGEIHRILRPGGRCFLAEPVSALGTVLPFAALRLAGWLVGAHPAQRGQGRSGHEPRRLTDPEFASIVQSQPWSDVDVTNEQGYLYATCHKPLGEPA
jgi:arsenite methyltransferase